MRDTSENSRSHLLHTAQATPVREPPQGEHVWTVTKNGRRIDCELRYHGDTYGWECQLLRDEELASARRVGPRAVALSEADRHRQRLLQKGLVSHP
jgi:hypothetical protein